MNKRYLFILLALMIVVVSGILLKPEKEKALNYRLKWVFNASVAGDIFAYTNNYFVQTGLKVELKEGSPESNAITELELGHADFGVASADQVIRALDKGARIKVIAQIFQVNPMQWIYRADMVNIETLQDLKGRRIGITYGGNDETIMNTLLAKSQLTKEEVFLSGVHFDFTPFLKKEVDVWPVYRNSQGVILQERLDKEGEKVGFLNPAEFGVRFVANSVITTEKMVAQNPDTVQKFLSALLKGWEAAMAPENTGTVLSAVKEMSMKTSDQVLEKQLVATRSLVKPSLSVKVGTIDVDAWKETEKIMLREKQIRRPVDIEKHLMQID